MKRINIINGLLLLFLVLVQVSVIPVSSTESGNDSLNSMDDRWLSHGFDAPLDYETVFPDDEIRDISITISPQSWTEMQEDMEEKYGEFGRNTMNNSGGFGPVIIRGNITLEDWGAQRPETRGPGMMNTEDPIYVEATVSFNGSTWEHVGLRYKGVNSLMTAWNSGIGKISLKLNMDRYEDDYPDTKNQRFYGFKELNLQSGMSDRSGIREKVVPEIFQEAGVPAPETAFYRVYLDHGNGIEYFGLYTLVESVDDSVIKTKFSDGSGNLYKPEGEGATFALGSLILASFEKKTNEKENDYSDINTLYTVLHSDSRINDPAMWRTDLESVLDVGGFLTWLATNTLIKNWDTYGGNSRNYYLYNNPDTGVLSWIPWDNNYALMDGMGSRFGEDDPLGMNRDGEIGMGMPPERTGLSEMASPDMSRDQIGKNLPPEWMNMTITGFDTNARPEMGPGGMGSSVSFSMEDVTDRWPLIRYFMDDPVYHQRYVDILSQVLENNFDITVLEERFDTYRYLIESSVIGPKGEWEGYTYLTDDSDFQKAFEDLKDHVRSQHEKATEYLYSQDVS